MKAYEESGVCPSLSLAFSQQQKTTKEQDRSANAVTAGAQVSPTEHCAEVPVLHTGHGSGDPTVADTELLHSQHTHEAWCTRSCQWPHTELCHSWRTSPATSSFISCPWWPTLWCNTHRSHHFSQMNEPLIEYAAVPLPCNSETKLRAKQFWIKLIQFQWQEIMTKRKHI